MTFPSAALNQTNVLSRLMAPAVLLLLPFAFALWFVWAALRCSAEDRAGVWLGFRRLNRFIMAATVALWWITWDLSRVSDVIPALEHSWLASIESPFAEALLFWFPPLLSLGLYLVLCYSFDGIILRLRWTPTDILRQAWWRLLSFAAPLLMVATGFDAIFDGRIAGLVWIAGAGLLARIGIIFLRGAEGMKLHELRSGETRNRAHAMARRMGVTLRRVYVVPAGRGHLTNAFGGSGAIGVTDNLGKYFNDRQVDWVLAHELAHVKQKHGLKQLLAAVATYSVVAVVLFGSRMKTLPFRVVLPLATIIVPLLILYFLSRYFEYVADREAVNLNGDAETAIHALANLHRISAAPPGCSRFTELFLTHPALKRRAQAIASAGKIPPEHVSHILNSIGKDKTRPGWVRSE